jgi:hypothetical protein
MEGMAPGRMTRQSRVCSFKLRTRAESSNPLGILKTPWTVLIKIGQKAPIKITKMEALRKLGNRVIAYGM